MKDCETANVFIIVKTRTDNKNDIREVLDVVADEDVAYFKVKRLNDENSNINMKYCYIERPFDSTGADAQVWQGNKKQENNMKSKKGENN